MDEHEDRKWVIEMKLPGASTADLRGRQSVRATFKLSAGCIDAISVVAKHLGIKQKSLFDHLAEDIQSLKSIADQACKTKYLLKENRVQKTFVISRRSLYSLEQVSKSYNTPRDALVECSVQRLLPLIANECEKHRKRKKMLTDIRKHLKKGVVLLDNLAVELGNEDPLYDKLASAMDAYVNAVGDMDDIIEQGNQIEMFDPDMVSRILEDQD